MATSRRFRMTVLVRPKEGMSFEDFFEYWQHKHAVLFNSIAISKKNLYKYEQFHVDPDSTAKLTKAWSPLMNPLPPYAGVAAFEADSPEKILEIFEDEEYLRVVAPDEDKFVDRPSMQVLGGYYVSIFDN
ncbi:hypothetical protein PYCCODRAFT_1476541 [Trametes coccinea BRFM310]|uniref:EthD domain-containing protein n=1 Tax=Trametes coccinea (strain BRFM310) TaxID=1353009 RepID=A0A1Y2IV08_TRAC3|nr:hypothetical protein PYCCODRAFT_1476541 [Trametes coccinea BRFM310]